MQYPQDHIAILRSQTTWITNIALRIAKGEYRSPPDDLSYALIETRDAAQKAINEIRRTIKTQSPVQRFFRLLTT